MASDDIDDMVQNDVEMVRDGFESLQGGGGGFDADPAQLGEYALWGVTALVALGFVGVMPWVGADGLLTGQQWLFGGLGGVLLGVLAAGAVRVARTQLGGGNRRLGNRARGKR